MSARLSDSTGLVEVRVYVDSARRPIPVATSGLHWRTSLGVVAFLPGPGQYRLTVAVTDTLGRVFSTALTRQVTLPEVAYAATALPDSGGGGNAFHVNAAGDVAGWVASAGGPQRPALWKGGVLTVVPTPGPASHGISLRTNAAGDVLLQLSAPVRRSDGVLLELPAPAVRRADGTLVLLGPAKRAFPPADGWSGGAPCCALASDLNDQGRVLITYYGGARAFYGPSVQYDVATGAVTDSTADWRLYLNNAGQVVGAATEVPNSGVSGLLTVGFAPPALPSGTPAATCGHTAGTFPVGFDNAANLLVTTGCRGSYAYLSAGGSTWLDRYVGPSVAARLSPQGGLVAALDSAGAVRVWNAATRRAATVRVGGGTTWRVDSLGWVNAGGAIAAHGVNTATGRAAALLLTPAAAP